MTEQIAVKQAVLVRHYRPGGKLGDAALYFVSPPILSDAFLVPAPVSYVVLSTTQGWTRVFPADGSGHIESWIDVVDIGPAGAESHEGVLAALGYTVVGWGEVKA